MKTKITLAIMLLIAVAAGTVNAQDKAAGDYKKFSFGFGLEGALPMGTFGTAYPYGGGLTLRATVGLNENMNVTLTSGGIAFIPKDVSSGTNLKAQINIPIKAGYQYMITSKFYGLGEAGETISKVYYPDASGNLQSLSSTSFTYSVGGGVKLGAFDAGVRYEGYSTSGYIGVRLGFNF